MTAEDWRDIFRLFFGTIFFFGGGWLVYNYRDGCSLTRRILSCGIFAAGMLLLLIPSGW